MTRLAGLAVVAALGAVGCATAAVEGPVRLTYQATVQRGKETRQTFEGMRITFVNVGNEAFVTEEGALKGDDATIKIVSDERMAVLLEALDDAGFSSDAQPGVLDDALEAGAREAIALEMAQRKVVVTEPARPLDTPDKKDRMRRFVAMKNVVFEEQLNHTQFSVVGNGRDRPKWSLPGR